MENLSKNFSHVYGCSEKERFEAELEFVQALASPHYLNYLAQKRYFEDEAFISYLQYLQYWKRQEYANYLIYPHCLYFLDLLQDKNFRDSMAITNVKDLIHTQQLYFYQYYRKNRLQKSKFKKEICE